MTSLTPLPVVRAFEQITKDRSAVYRGLALQSALRGREKLTASSLNIEINALRDVADELEVLANKKAREHGE